MAYRESNEEKFRNTTVGLKKDALCNCGQPAISLQIEATDVLLGILIKEINLAHGCEWAITPVCKNCSVQSKNTVCVLFGDINNIQP